MAGHQSSIIEKVLNHLSRSFVGVYPHSFDSEKRDALEFWARHVESITGAQPSNVVPLRG
jgi:hypothetical protein